MSNNFKSNSRFAVLAEETTNTNIFNKKNKNDKTNSNKSNDKEVKKEENTFTTSGNIFKNNSDTHFRSSNNIFDSEKNNENRENRKKEKEKKSIQQKEEDNIKKLDIGNFPVLLENPTNKINVGIQSKITEGFIDKVKFVKPVAEIVINENYIKPGWIEIKHDPKTKRIITTGNILSNNDEYDKPYGNIVLNKLVTLHENRTKEYIDLWGHDMWENVFQFPNYDYRYFDKLDEEYDSETQSYESENEDETNDEYDNYYSN